MSKYKRKKYWKKKYRDCELITDYFMECFLRAREDVRKQDQEIDSLNEKIHSLNEIIECKEREIRRILKYDE